MVPTVLRADGVTLWEGIEGAGQDRGTAGVRSFEGVTLSGMGAERAAQDRGTAVAANRVDACAQAQVREEGPEERVLPLSMCRLQHRRHL